MNRTWHGWRMALYAGDHRSTRLIQNGNAALVCYGSRLRHQVLTGRLLIGHVSGKIPTRCQARNIANRFESPEL
jgi:hypothetical protein